MTERERVRGRQHSPPNRTHTHALCTKLIISAYTALFTHVPACTRVLARTHESNRRNGLSMCGQMHSRRLRRRLRRRRVRTINYLYMHAVPCMCVCLHVCVQRHSRSLPRTSTHAFEKGHPHARTRESCQSAARPTRACSRVVIFGSNGDVLHAGTRAPPAAS